MRLWSLHPKYLDARGLVALWREGLLAQAVLSGSTRGYLRHPQLARFKQQPQPAAFIAQYLRSVHAEAARRGYRFAAEKIKHRVVAKRLTVTHGQIEFEWQHLMKKLKARDRPWRTKLATVKSPQPHPLFRIVAGGVAPWEKDAAAHRATRQRHRLGEKRQQ